MTGPPSYLKVWIRHCFLFHWFLKRQILIRAERYLCYRWAPFLADCVLVKEWTELYASGLYASDKKTTPRSNIYTVLKTSLLFFSWCSVRGLFIYFAGNLGRFPFRKKTRKFRWKQKWNFRLVKSWSILTLNPGTSRCPTVDLELVQTTRKVNGTRHSVRKFQPGKRAHLSGFSTFSGNFLVGRAYETCSIYRRTRNSGNFD